jgi:anaerobic selenocysteine-containing dehydrogenase
MCGHRTFQRHQRVGLRVNVLFVGKPEFYTSGRASNEAAFLYQLFVRAYGTNNFPDCSSMCPEASAVSMIEGL